MEGGRKTWIDSVAQGLQANLPRLAHDVDAIPDWSPWPFDYNEGLNSACKPCSSFSLAFDLLRHLEQSHGSRCGKGHRKAKACKQGLFLLDAGLFSFEEDNSRSTVDSSQVTVPAHDLRHLQDVETTVSGSSYTNNNPSCRSESLGESSYASTPSLRISEPSGASGWIEKAAMASVQAKAMMKDISILERAQIGAGAGGIAGVITYACLHPLDTIKTKLQTRGASHLYSGPLDVVVKTFKNQGILGFYSGISAVLVGSMLSSGVYFGTCELGKALLMQVSSLPAILVPPIAGACGNIASSAILVPKELITQRMQAGAQGRSWEVFIRTLEKEGLKGLYTGYSAALVRNLPASVLSFSSFEYLKSAWMKRTRKNSLDPWQSVVSGALAGVISSALTTPLDVVKTRLMTQARAEIQKASHGSSSSMAAAELQARIAASTYEGITSTIRKIWIEEGWIGLTKGIVPRILYSACFSALGYFAFETARLALAKRHLEKKKTVVY